MLTMSLLGFPGPFPTPTPIPTPPVINGTSF